MKRIQIAMQTAVAGIAVAALIVALGGCARQPQPEFKKTADGVLITPTQGPAKRVRLQVMSDRIVRVTAMPADTLQPQSLAVVAQPQADTKFSVESKDGKVTLKTSQVTAEVTMATGVVNFVDANGKTILGERDRGTFEPVKADDKELYRVHQLFNPGTDEAFYGLGQHQNAVMNYNGEDVELAQHNMDIAVPFVLSSRNYGLLWDTNSVTRFGDPKPYGLASRDLTLYDADGKKGGLTASYSVNARTKSEARRARRQLSLHQGSRRVA